MYDDEPAAHCRWSLDALIRRLLDPLFAARFRRRRDTATRTHHVNPLMMAQCDAQSPYVQQWRRHAASCRSCSFLFKYFGFE